MVAKHEGNSTSVATWQTVLPQNAITDETWEEGQQRSLVAGNVEPKQEDHREGVQ